MRKGPLTWRRRCLAGGLAAAVAMAGVGVAVAGQGGGPEPHAELATAVGEPLDDVTSFPLKPSAEASPSTSDLEVSVPTTPPGGGSDDADGPHRAASRPATTSDTSVASLESSDRTPPPRTSTTLDVRRMLGEREAAAASEPTGAEGLAAELESQVRACVADLLDDVQSSFDGQPDADRIQSFASDVVDDVLACVAGLVDVGQVLGCVSEVIQEIVAVVMTMDLADLPELIREFADDVVRCVSG